MAGVSPRDDGVVVGIVIVVDRVVVQSALVADVTRLAHTTRPRPGVVATEVAAGADRAVVDGNLVGAGKK